MKMGFVSRMDGREFIIVMKVGQQLPMVPGNMAQEKSVPGIGNLAVEKPSNLSW